MKRVSIITGASKGIGLALSKKLLNNDYRVIGSSRTGNIQSIAHQMFESFPLDLSNKESIKQFVNWLSTKKIKIDLLINNAGIGPDLNLQTPEEISFEETFDVNVKGTVFFTESILPYIKKGGRILNVSSKMGSIDYCDLSDSPAYRMSKSALNMYSKILSNRLNNFIKVASIHPGWVKTTLTESNVNARLTPEESADKIFHYLETKFENGDFWDAESSLNLEW
jgi:Dehydrogenases with different specificities (related to short-chain alcohol dehydrogenases)